MDKTAALAAIRETFAKKNVKDPELLRALEAKFLEGTGEGQERGEKQNGKRTRAAAAEEEDPNKSIENGREGGSGPKKAEQKRKRLGSSKTKSDIERNMEKLPSDQQINRSAIDALSAKVKEQMFPMIKFATYKEIQDIGLDACLAKFAGIDSKRDSIRFQNYQRAFQIIIKTKLDSMRRDTARRLKVMYREHSGQYSPHNIEKGKKEFAGWKFAGN